MLMFASDFIRRQRPMVPVTRLLMGVGFLFALSPDALPAQPPAARSVAAVRSASQDSTAVVQLSTAMLAALSARDTAAVRGMLVPGAFLAAVMDPAPAQGVARIQTEAQFIATLATGTERLLERMWSPRVHLYGPLAEVHAPYDFHINGNFSHCGTDVFTLMRHQGAWKIVSITYTMQRSGCTPSPLGPPND